MQLLVNRLLLALDLPKVAVPPELNVRGDTLLSVFEEENAHEFYFAAWCENCGTNRRQFPTFLSYFFSSLLSSLLFSSFLPFSEFKEGEGRKRRRKRACPCGLLLPHESRQPQPSRQGWI